MARSAPLSRSRCAVARAMPDAPPTMTAFLPSISTGLPCLVGSVADAIGEVAREPAAVAGLELGPQVVVAGDLAPALRRAAGAPHRRGRDVEQGVVGGELL